MKNDNGFTLLEAMIALFILSIGVIGAAVMQLQAIRGNDSAMARTKANDLALSVMEELKRLPFDDAMTCQAGPTVFNAAALNTGSNIGGAVYDPTLTAAPPGHIFKKAGYPDFPFPGTYTMAGNSLVDNTGRTYQVFWNVNLDPFGTGVQPQPSCLINLFVYWQSPMGQQHLQYATMKYKNIKIAL